MSGDADQRGRTVTGYNPKIATVSEAEFAELMALARAQPRLTPDGQWRHDYHAAMIARRTIGVQPDLFGAKPIIHMHRTRPGPVSDWQPEPVEAKLDRLARDPHAAFGIGRPAMSDEEKVAMIRAAANWLRLGQRVRLIGSSASIDGQFERRVGRVGVVWRISRTITDYVHIYLDPVGAERAEKIIFVELRDVEPIEDEQ
ncbi:MAG: hypothetical protein IPG54_01730 [Sphingomonadales bacterium]|jgi:hypothetical protein|nr:hypothetical protein [Sphingomonadales bacterium]MBK9003552.1 hypothetical protein [Sphingomonadales bacterium]MBK9268753.1 hypothetical protein [Sphingomonadales bacterium]